MRLRFAVAVLFLVLLTACEVRVGLDVNAERDGSGTMAVSVTLDRDAASQVDDLAGQLAVDDLRKAGWVVTGPDPVAGEKGAVRIVASHPFSDPSQVTALAAQISGDGGPFHDLRLERDRSFAKTTLSFAGTVDLTAGVEAFADQRLREQVGGAPFGGSPEAIERRLGTALAKIFRFRVSTDLAGRAEGNAPTVEGGQSVWAPQLGQKVDLTATSVSWNFLNLLAAFGSVLFAGLAVAAVFRTRQVRARQQRRTKPDPPII